MLFVKLRDATVEGIATSEKCFGIVHYLEIERETRARSAD
jgi:hypothetical protein